MRCESFDKIIIGAGLYGLYAAIKCGEEGQHICVLEREPEPFMRATYINQARIHMGYHYPRSLATAMKSAGYFERFVDEFGFCVNGDFDQIYATSAHLGWTTAEEFSRFCSAACIPCEEVRASRYFRPGMCDGAFLTKEYAYDAAMLRDALIARVDSLGAVEIRCDEKIGSIAQDGELWHVESTGRRLSSPYILNATYAGVNDIHGMAGFERIPIKYELCEIILCRPNDALEGIGLTVMDGPFFSIMPFGRTGYHSLTSVTFTPHMQCRESLGAFPCQSRARNGCAPGNLCNCNACDAKPQSAWPTMSALARKYMREEFAFAYDRSLYSMKPIMLASEVDDSRPTVIRTVSDVPRMVSVLSGKVNTVYDLDPFL